jgi:hypothetical protein
MSVMTATNARSPDMDDDGFRHAIQRAFDRYEMSPTTTLQVSGRATSPLGGPARTRLPRLAATLVAVAISAAVLAIAVTPAQPAFASWRATPSSADQAVVTRAQTDCAASDPENVTGLELIASEQRGEYIMLLFGDDRAYGMCLTGPDIEPTILTGPGTVAVDAPGGPTSVGGDHGQTGDLGAPGVLFVTQPGSDSPIAQRVQAWIVGVTPGVARVVLERDGAEPTVATMGDGVAFAWWPAGTEAVAIAAYDANAELVQRIPVSGSMITEH